MAKGGEVRSRPNQEKHLLDQGSIYKKIIRKGQEFRNSENRVVEAMVGDLQSSVIDLSRVSSR